jgi:hypothetical protein
MGAPNCYLGRAGYKSRLGAAAGRINRSGVPKIISGRLFVGAIGDALNIKKPLLIGMDLG